MESGANGTPHEYKFKLQQRVRRIGQQGCQGVVKNIRIEVTATGEARHRAPMFVVLWDNGTQSYMAQDSIEAVS